jgi:hypothetical protein
MSFGSRSIPFRLLLVNGRNLLVIRAGARRFDFLFNASKPDRPFNRATAQN